MSVVPADLLGGAGFFLETGGAVGWDLAEERCLDVGVGCALATPSPFEDLRRGVGEVFAGEAEVSPPLKEFRTGALKAFTRADPTPGPG